MEGKSNIYTGINLGTYNISIDLIDWCFEYCNQRRIECYEKQTKNQISYY